MVGGNFTITFTSKAAVKNFLNNNNGASHALTVSLVNPTTSGTGTFGNQVVTMKLNILRDAALANQTYTGIGANSASPFYGLTIGQILADAHVVLGGGTSAYLASGNVPGALTSVLGDLIEMYHCQ